jgi:hypothetical protein
MAALGGLAGALANCMSIPLSLAVFGIRHRNPRKRGREAKTGRKTIEFANVRLLQRKQYEEPTF